MTPSMIGVQCAVYTIHYSVQCTVYSVQCRLFGLPRTMKNNFTYRQSLYHPLLQSYCRASAGRTAWSRRIGMTRRMTKLIRSTRTTTRLDENLEYNAAPATPTPTPTKKAGQVTVSTIRGAI